MSGQVDEGAGPVGGDHLALANLAVTLAAHAPASTCRPVRSRRKEVDHRLHVAQGPVGAKLLVMLGLEVLVEHLAKQRRGLPKLVALVLHRDAGPL